MLKQIQEWQKEIKWLSLNAKYVVRQQCSSRPTRETQNVSGTAYEPSISLTETDESSYTNSKTSWHLWKIRHICKLPISYFYRRQRVQ